MSSGFNVAIDQGTHASRALLLDRAGKTLEVSHVEIGLNRISDVEVEQDPIEIIHSVQKVFKQVTGEFHDRALVAGMATQRSSVVAWRKSTKEPLSPVLSWLDRRASDKLESLKDKEERIREKTGLPLSPHYGASKLQWLLEQTPVQKAGEEGDLVFGPLSAFLIHHLTGSLLVDHANASRTLLWNLSTTQWDPDLLQWFGIPADFLPQPVPICHHYGLIQGTKIPLKAVTGDQNAAVLARGFPARGEVIANLGSGAFLLKPVGEMRPEQNRLLCGLIYSDGKSRLYALEGTVNGCALALQWAGEEMIKRFGQSAAVQEVDHWWKEIKNPPVFRNSIGGLGSPYWSPGPEPGWQTDPETPRHAVVSVLESILFLLQVNIDAMRSAGQLVEQVTMTGGLSKISSLCQGMADLSGAPVYRPAESEASALGAARLASNQMSEIKKESYLSSSDAWFYPGASTDSLGPGPGFHDRYREFLQAIRPG